LLLLICLALLAACGANGAEVYEPEIYEPEACAPEETTPPPPARNILLPAEGNASDFSADAAYLVELIEAVHPIFILEGRLPDYYDALRAEFLAYTAQPISRNAFVLAIRRYFTTLHDLHASIWPQTASTFITEPFIFRDGRLFLLYEPDVEILAIGGVDIADIFYQIDRHVFHENEAHRAVTYRLQARNIIYLHMAGAEIYYYTARIRPPAANFIVRHRMIDDVFFIDLRTCTDGPHMYPVVEAIEQAIADGIYKFIIDVRGNPGGSSMPGIRMLEAMGITSPRFGVTRRVSEQLVANWRAQGFEPDFDTSVERIDFLPDYEIAENPNNVFISVLTDNFTASAAMEIGVRVQDGNFGNIIGEPSANAPSCFGATSPYTLPNSGLNVSISSSWIARPNPNADQNTLYPDIWTEAADALDVALEYLARR
jgi:hypothetical protein